MDLPPVSDRLYGQRRISGSREDGARQGQSLGSYVGVTTMLEGTQNFKMNCERCWRTLIGEMKKQLKKDNT
ncbi:unnamed protein product [Tetraodon nigroviridis]|uniref:(spotted green pufferfish) hypothetical protein n=1 Tax=Tetraodon nigroviridis TaxID=99883 RepID=Q4SCN7_TETNG|nr:unnamed protein product [Tetraodon nigroviridis]